MLSIIIPAWNEERYLPRLLDCLRKQSYGSYEVIVADAGSRDRTRQIAKEYGCIVVKGGLPAAGRNNGAKKARGDLLLFLDADVRMNRDFLKNALKEFNEKNLDAAGCYVHPDSDKLIDRLFFAIFNLWTSTTQYLYPNASGGGIFCRKWIHEKINGFDEKIRLSEDMDYVRRCSKYGKFRILRMADAFVSMRRFEKEGRLRVGLKLLLSAVYRLIFGEIKSDVFKYSMKYRK